MKKLLIIGYGKWGKKIVKNLINAKVYNEIYIKTKNAYYQCDFRLIKKKTSIDIPLKKYDRVHICVPTNQHYSVLQNYINIKNLSIEKPLFNQLKFFKKLKKKTIKVNYTDLYNPITKFFFKNVKEEKITTINLDYCGKYFFHDQYIFLDEWLDHPLSLLFCIFNKIQLKKIKTFKIDRVKKLNIFEAILKYNNLNIKISLKTNLVKKRLITLITKTNEKIIYDFSKNKIFKNKKLFYKANTTSIENFFKLRNKRSEKIQIESLNFHKKIFKFKRKILLKSKKELPI